MDLDLSHVLENTRKGQWSVHEFDWDAPLQGAEGLTKDELRQAGLMILFTAGLERQAAKIFGLCAKHVSDKTAKQIYEFFERDENRHAEAEILMARRYGVEWKDLPLPTRLMFETMKLQWVNPTQVLHELTSAQIVFFEIGLDALLIPALKRTVNDPLQAEVFRRIDIDESRHLAMDYWLLERRGQGLEPSLDKMERSDLWRFVPFAIAGAFGFRAMTRTAGDFIRKMNGPENQKRFWNRVDAIPERAPSAPKLRLYRQGLRIQKDLQRMMGRSVGLRPFDHQSSPSARA
ncbi:MAG: ferritin-like domain-containing protein [Bdellovibrionota bacterium]